jgi:hypothetical protein
MTHAYFRRDGRLFVPDRSARGPWNPDHQSGLAIAGLLALAIESTPAAGPMRVARLTIDFLGPVLMRPTEARARVLREGRRQQVIEAELVVEDVVVATATGVRLSEIEGPLAESGPLDYPGPEAAPRVPVTKYFDAGHPLETRVVQPATAEGQPGVFWARFNTQFVEGEPTSPVIRACMTGDLATGAAVTPQMRGWRYPNTDLSIYFARAPRGDWQLCVANMDVATGGGALTRTTLADETGVFGYGRQALVLSRI